MQIWEGSANRDASVFDDADFFDIARKPNPHLGFGQGVHYCLGANLARLELRVLFEELLARFSSVQVVKPVEWTRSNRHTGIRHLVVELRARETGYVRGGHGDRHRLDRGCGSRLWRYQRRA